MRNNQKIPDGWSVKKLGEISQVITGSTPQTLDVTNYGNEFLFVSPADINDNVKYITDTTTKLSSKGFSLCRIIKKGSPMFVCIGSTIGKTALAGIDLATNQQINSCIVKNCINNEFLYYNLSFQSNKIRLLAGEQAVPIINKSTFEKIKLSIPPLSEQEKIAEILGTWDEAIEKLTNLIEQKKLLKKGLMQRLLAGKIRLFKTSQGTRKNERFSQPWKTVKIGEIGIITSAGVDKKIIEGENLVRLLNYMDVYRKDFLYSTDTSMTVSASERQIKNCDLKKGDIFFTPSSETRDDIAHSAVIMEDICNGVYSYHIVRLRPTKPIDLKFSAYAFKTNIFYKQAYAWCAGSGQRYVLSQNDFRNMIVFIPSDLSEQQAIADVLSKADEEIDLLNKKLILFKEQKKGLMQQLLTGNIRVKV